MNALRDEPIRRARCPLVPFHTTWPELAIDLYEKLTGRGAEINIARVAFPVRTCHHLCDLGCV